jgi:hypothetical protein
MSFILPAAAIDKAKTGLAQRREYGRGGLTPAEAAAQGIQSGITRAHNIASGRVDRNDVCRMAAFNRHRTNGHNPKKHSDGGPSNGVIAWNLWGGDPGVDWAISMKSAAGCGSAAGPSSAPAPLVRRRSAVSKKRRKSEVQPRRDPTQKRARHSSRRGRA